MQVQINGKQIDIGDSLRNHVTGRLEHGVFKYFDRPVDAQVTFSRDGHEYKADCSVHLSSGMRLQAHGRSTDIYACYDMAADRLEKRLRRYKRRLKDHHNTHQAPLPAMDVPAYVIQAEDEGAEETAEQQPIIIAETTASVQEMSVSQAVMQLDLSEDPALLFRNGATGGLSVVYRRADGNIGWIDTSPKPGEASGG